MKALNAQWILHFTRLFTAFLEEEEGDLDRDREFFCEFVYLAKVSADP